jgi:VWFA-related protein
MYAPMTRVVGWVMAATIAAALDAGVEQRPFTARTTLVRVDVSVTDRGTPITGLRESDFQIRDNGILQQVEFFSVETMPVSLALALDWSGSVAGERLDHLRRATTEASDALRPGDRAGLITFSHVIALQVSPTTDREPLRAYLAPAATWAALNQPTASGGTALVDASYAGLLLPGDEDFRHALIVFSDGIETTSWLTPEAVLDTAARTDVVAYTVSAGGRTRVAFLRDLASATGGSHFEVESTRELGRTFVEILAEFRQRYVLSYRPRGVSGEGWHRLDVRVSKRGATVKARTGYVAR